MPEKKIAKDILVRPDGQVCAIGNLLVHRRMRELGETREQAVAACARMDEYDTEYCGIRAGLPRLVAWSVAVENDIDPWRPLHRDGPILGNPARGHLGRYEWTDEERYERMLR